MGYGEEKLDSGCNLNSASRKDKRVSSRMPLSSLRLSNWRKWSCPSLRQGRLKEDQTWGS